MRRVIVPVALGFLIFAGSFLASSAALEASGVHLALDRSIPEAGSEVRTVERIAVWFTQVPQENSVSLRLVDPSGQLVPTGDVARWSDDPAGFAVILPNPLKAGTYTVRWRAMGDDGHVVNGEFSFSVLAH